MPPSPPPPEHRREVAALALDDDAMQGCPLGADHVLEIVARSDAATLVRCAASCKPLRREILRPAFIRRVCHGPGAVVPPYLVGFLDHSIVPWSLPSFTLTHPTTMPAAVYLSENHIAPFLSRRIAGDDSLVASRTYKPLTSRHGLVLLLSGMLHGNPVLDLCVYNPMDINYRFLRPPIISDSEWFYQSNCSKFVLLTAADGVTTCSFLLLAFDFCRRQERARSVIIWTFSSDGSAWSPARHSPPDMHDDDMRPPGRGDAAVVLDGLIYCLLFGTTTGAHRIFTYNVLMQKAGWIELPAEVSGRIYYQKLHLASSPSGRLSLLAVREHEISVWSSSAAGWELHAVIDTPTTLSRQLQNYGLTIVGSGERSGVVVLLPVQNGQHYLRIGSGNGLILLDLETKEMQAVNKYEPAYFMYHVERKRVFLYEIDLISRISAMKIL